MQQVESTPTACEGALSLLQSIFDQALEAGLLAKLEQIPMPGDAPPMLRLDIFGVIVCDVCKVWTTMTPCPVCSAQTAHAATG